jgi:hypothetical protein
VTAGVGRSQALGLQGQGARAAAAPSDEGYYVMQT